MHWGRILTAQLKISSVLGSKMTPGLGSTSLVQIQPKNPRIGLIILIFFLPGASKDFLFPKPSWFSVCSMISSSSWKFLPGNSQRIFSSALGCWARICPRERITQNPPKEFSHGHKFQSGALRETLSVIKELNQPLISHRTALISHRTIPLLLQIHWLRNAGNSKKVESVFDEAGVGVDLLLLDGNSTAPLLWKTGNHSNN